MDYFEIFFPHNISKIVKYLSSTLLFIEKICYIFNNHHLIIKSLTLISFNRFKKFVLNFYSNKRINSLKYIKRTIINKKYFFLYSELI